MNLEIAQLSNVFTFGLKFAFWVLGLQGVSGSAWQVAEFFRLSDQTSHAYSR